MERCEHGTALVNECPECYGGEKPSNSALSGRVMCKCGCQGKASYIVESEDYEGRPFKEPCCINATIYLRDGAATFDKPYKETPCT